MDWLEVLRDHCTKSSQSKVAQRLGYSSSLICQVLKGKYLGDLKGVEIKVRAVLIGERVECPVLGDTAKTVCLEEQSKAFAATSHLRVQLWIACRSDCPHSQIKEPGHG